METISRGFHNIFCDMSKKPEKVLGPNCFRPICHASLVLMKALLRPLSYVLGHEKIVFLKVQILCDRLRGVLRTQSNIFGGAFFAKIISGFFNYFLKESSIIDV